jgi:hypothetical protein
VSLRTARLAWPVIPIPIPKQRARNLRLIGITVVNDPVVTEHRQGIIECPRQSGIEAVAKVTNGEGSLWGLCQALVHSVLC